MIQCERSRYQLLFISNLDDDMDISALGPSVLNISRPERDAMIGFRLLLAVSDDSDLNDEFGLYTEDMVIAIVCLTKKRHEKHYYPHRRQIHKPTSEQATNK